MLFIIVGIVISALGFIGGIITGISTHDFLYCVIAWAGTFLYAIIYFEIGVIINNQEYLIMKQKQAIQNQANIDETLEKLTNLLKNQEDKEDTSKKRDEDHRDT